MGLVGSRSWHDIDMIQPDSDEQGCQPIEYNAPRKGVLIAEHYLQDTSHRNTESNKNVMTVLPPDLMVKYEAWVYA